MPTHNLHFSDHIANGYRFSQAPTTLIIQDLVTGRWAALGLQRSPVEAATVNGGARILYECARQLPELALPAAEMPPGQPVLAAEVAAALERLEPCRQAPTYPVPTVNDLMKYATAAQARPLSGCVKEDVLFVSYVACALAWRGGEARDAQLEQDLIGVLPDRKAARRAMDIARARSGGNILQAGRGSAAVWKMPPAWSVTPWVC